MKTTEDEKTRKTQYAKGREDAEKEFSLLLSIFIDSYPNTPSAATLARFGAHVEGMTVDIGSELRRFATVVKKSAKSATAEAA